MLRGELPRQAIRVDLDAAERARKEVVQDLENAHRSPGRKDADEGSSPDPGRELPYAVGIVNHRAYADLARCLVGVEAQSHPAEAVVVVDHDPLPEERAPLCARFARVAWRSGPNRGYAGGANTALEELARRAPLARFFLLLNPDVVLDPDFARILVCEVSRRPRVALATGKLLRPDDGRIDSAGMLLPRHRRPRDRGAGEQDAGRYERCEVVFGASGSALLLRRSALADLALEGELFDEDFFAYYEDTDLAWRANLLGWRVLYVPAARALHRRGWRREGRFAVDVGVRRHSFANHYLQLIKNEPAAGFLRNLPWIVGWELVRLGFAATRDPAVLAGYRDAWRLSGRAWHKRAVLQERARERRRRSEAPWD